MLVALPAAFYTAVHWAALASWNSLWSLLILAAAPWCFLLALEGDSCPPPFRFCAEALATAEACALQGVSSFRM